MRRQYIIYFGYYSPVDTLLSILHSLYKITAIIRLVNYGNGINENCHSQSTDKNIQRKT